MLSVRRVFASPLYEIFICVYSGLIDSKALNDDLVTCLVVFRKEQTRVLFKLLAAEIRGDRGAYIEMMIQKMEAKGQGPLHLVRDAKVWAKLPFTDEDRKVIASAGIESEQK
jgi:hypothetical protein